MSTPTLAVTTLTRAEFDQLEHRGAAGATPAFNEATILDRWRADYPRWRGRHWAFLDPAEDGVLRLHPVNVARATRRQSSAA